MTLTILSQTETERSCDQHPEVKMVEVLVAGTELRNEWMLTICPECQREAIGVFMGDQPEEES